jgi:copper ion binding protein
MKTMFSRKTVFAVMAASSLVLGARPTRAEDAAPGVASVTLHVEGMSCASCKAAVKTAIARLPGVTDAKVDLEKKSATVEYDASKVSPQKMVDAVNQLGFEASLPAATGR